MLGYFSLRAFQIGATAAGFLGIGLAAASFWQVWPMVTLNRPRDTRHRRGAGRSGAGRQRELRRYLTTSTEHFARRTIVEAFEPMT